MEPRFYVEPSLTLTDIGEVCVVVVAVTIVVAGFSITVVYNICSFWEWPGVKDVTFKNANISKILTSSLLSVTT